MSCNWYQLLSTLFSSAATAPPQISTLSLHDALPIFSPIAEPGRRRGTGRGHFTGDGNDDPAGSGAGRIVVAVAREVTDRKSTRLNSSHRTISYAVFCLKKKKKTSIVLIC